MQGICSDCKYSEKRAGKEPCCDCTIDDDKFTPKEEPMNVPVCQDCVEDATDSSLYPCNHCKGMGPKHAHSYFFPKEEPTMQDPRGNIFRAGDILVGLETGREIFCEKIINKVAHFCHRKGLNTWTFESNTFRIDQPSLNISHWIKKEKPMKLNSHTPDPPTTSQILSAAEDCPDAKRALKRLYPRVFDKSVELDNRTSIKCALNGGHTSIVWVSGVGRKIELNRAFNWERSPDGMTLTPTRK